MKKTGSNTRGFTLIELTATLLLTGVLAVSSMSLIAYVTQGFGVVRRHAVLAADIELAMGRLVRESRDAATVTVGTGSIAFTRDGVTRTFMLAGNALVLDNGTVAFPLMRRVTGFNAQIVPVGDAVLVAFTITPDGGAPVYSTQVFRPRS